ESPLVVAAELRRAQRAAPPHAPEDGPQAMAVVQTLSEAMLLQSRTVAEAVSGQSRGARRGRSRRRLHKRISYSVD
ncbi:hypothetical protein, partial [Rhodobaculum claviforme]